VPRFDAILDQLRRRLSALDAARFVASAHVVTTARFEISAGRVRTSNGARDRLSVWADIRGARLSVSTALGDELPLDGFAASAPEATSSNPPWMIPPIASLRGGSEAQGWSEQSGEDTPVHFAERLRAMRDLNAPAGTQLRGVMLEVESRTVHLRDEQGHDWCGSRRRITFTATVDGAHTGDQPWTIASPADPDPEEVIERAARHARVHKRRTSDRAFELPVTLASTAVAQLLSIVHSRVPQIEGLVPRPWLSLDLETGLPITTGDVIHVKPGTAAEAEPLILHIDDVLRIGDDLELVVTSADNRGGRLIVPWASLERSLKEPSLRAASRHGTRYGSLDVFAPSLVLLP
jgi:hypothetical protein